MYAVICTNYTYTDGAGDNPLLLTEHGNWTSQRGYTWATPMTFENEKEALEYIKDYSQLPSDAEYKVVRIR